MNHWTRKSTALWTILLVAVAGTVLAVDEFEITRSTVDGGGAMESTGGGFSLSGTIGQPDAGVMTSGDGRLTGEYQLTGGFWFETPPGDCNATGLVDLLDYFDFDVEVCITGPTGGIVAGCECFDVDRNGSVSLRDFGIIQASFTNP